MEDIASQISGRVMPSKFVDAARELRRDTDVQNRFIAHNLASPFSGVEGVSQVAKFASPDRSAEMHGPMVLDLSRSEKDPEIQSQHLQQLSVVDVRTAKDAQADGLRDLPAAHVASSSSIPTASHRRGRRPS